MMRSVKTANLTPLITAALVLTAVAALAGLSSRGNHAEAVTIIDINVGSNFFCTPGQNPCPANNPYDTTVAASNGDTIKFTQQSGTHTASHCTDDTFSDCTGNLFDFASPATGEWPVSVNNSNVYFKCRFHPQMTGLIIVGSPITPTPTPAPAPTPTPAATPTPVPVGGIADFPDIDESLAVADGSSGSSSFALALVGGLMAALAMFTAGAWYARRRWLR